ncbi:MAG: hypothetical protein RMJ82_07280, partial [Gemmatales bacterium]|nr:hypothetical protein [Gemmatales bacterium]
MKGWLLRLWAKLLGYGDAFAVRGAPRRGRSGLHFEQLEDRTVPAAYLVRDIRVGLLTSWSRALNNVNGTLFFIANDGQHGYELWKSDGTSSGTVMVHDIRPGPASAFPPGGPYSQYSHGLHHPLGAEVNGTLFFVVNDGSNGYELWKSDGTSSGTVLVRDIRPGGHSAFLTRIPASLTNVNGTLFFVANDGQHGAELWKSDGTSSGTLLAWDIHPLSPGSFRFHDGLSFDGRPILANVEGVLFFSANNGSHGGELWRYAPLHGASLVRDTNPGSLGSYPYNLTNVNGTLFFTAYDRSHGSELWKSDGTASGTLLVRDIFPGVYPSNLRHFTDVNGTLFFTAWDGSTGFELWRSDGTATGTRLVADIVPGSASSGVSRLTNVNGTLFFQANDRSTGTELWKSDGTSTGTVLVRDINPGSYGSEPIRFANVNGTLFFTTFSWTAPYGRELWKSDGTSSGTVVVRDISPGHRGSYPYNLTNVNGTLFFTAADPVHGRELWATDFVSPTIVNFTLPPGGTYTAGQHLDFTVQFSETVVVNTSGNTARLELTIGTTTRFANYVSGSGTNTLLFRYTVQAGDLDTDGITLHSPLQLNGDTIRDNAGNDAVLTFTPPNTSGVLVDAVAPTIVSITPPANGTYTAGQHLNFTVQFSETVVVNTSG